MEDVKLYKYQDWSRPYHRKSFLNGEVFFSNNFNLNDPFDCQLPMLTSGFLPFNQTDMIKQFTEMYNRQPTSTEIQKLNIAWKNNPKNLKYKKQTDLKLAHQSKEIENRLGILCLSKNCKNTVMWGHYADSHKGYCVGYNKKLLANHFKDVFQNSASFVDVTYSSKIPIFEFNKFYESNYPEEMGQLRFSTKDEDWSYEEEVRVIVSNFTNKTVKIPKKAYNRLILGYRMPESVKNELIILSKEIYPEIQIYQSTPNKDKFGMSIEKIKRV